MNKPDTTKVLDSDPVLIKWAVKYDDVFSMPEYAQGTYISTSTGHTELPIKNGEFIRIHDVQIFDMFNKILITKSGQKFYLSGSGSRIFMVDNDKMMEMQMEKMREIMEDDEDN